jgi:hypothetical protein
MNQRMTAERGRLTADRYRSIQKEKARRAAECAAGFSIESTSPTQAMDLADLYAEAELPEKVTPAITKALSARASDPAELAPLMGRAVAIVMKLPVSAARDHEAESYVSRMDQLPDSFTREKIQAHARMNSYYRADDIDRGIIEHSAKIVALGRKLNNDERKVFAGPLTSAYANLAEAFASQGQPEKALEALRSGPADLAGVPDVERTLSWPARGSTRNPARNGTNRRVP